MLKLFSLFKSTLLLVLNHGISVQCLVVDPLKKANLCPTGKPGGICPAGMVRVNNQDGRPLVLPDTVKNRRVCIRHTMAWAEDAFPC